MIITKRKFEEMKVKLNIKADVQNVTDFKGPQAVDCSLCGAFKSIFNTTWHLITVHLFLKSVLVCHGPFLLHRH